MREVGITSLAEIKTVFGSNSDNIHYFELLKSSDSHIINNVELARPIIRESNSTIIWKAEFLGELKSFNKVSENKQAEVSRALKVFFDAFDNKINRFKNVSKDFSKKIIEIPNKNSLYVNEEQNYIVITNWGFLEDSFSRKEGVIEKLFSKERSSILVKLINKKGNPLPNIKLRLESKLEREFSVTDEKGYARFGTLLIGEEFNIYRDNGFEENLLASFKSNKSQEYEIIVEQEIEIKIALRDQNLSPISNENLKITSREVGKLNLTTDEFGFAHFNHSVVNDSFNVFNDFDEIIFHHEVPDENSEFEIIIDKKPDKSPIDFFESESDNQKDQLPNSKTIKFVNHFGTPIKNLNVRFWNSSITEFERKTNNKGEIQIESTLNSDLNYSLYRFNKPWNSNINLNASNFHIIQINPIFPWLWWLLILILTILLICCLFFNCFCNNNQHYAIEDTNIEEYLEPEIQNEISNQMPCNTSIESGGAGITTNKHYLGNSPGTVVIRYDMKYIPDKLEVFYENQLVASTKDIPNNYNGFVGGDNEAGCCGSLSFNYEPNRDDFCIIRVSGLNSTVWEYYVVCP